MSTEPVIQPAADNWEAIYYPNPVPLSSRTLLASALLFDRLHFPGVLIPQEPISADRKAELRREFEVPLATYRNLGLWAIELPDFGDFVCLPDQQHQTFPHLDSLVPIAAELLDDTYGEGISATVEEVSAAEDLYPLVQTTSKTPTMSLTWPLYQARALQYSNQSGLPLVSDDVTCIPPLPRHPTSDSWPTKNLAQQLAVEAISLALPPFRSVELAEIVEFRQEVQPLAKAFRVEMIKATADLHAAIAAGTDERDLKRLCRSLAESRLNPAVQDLSRQLRDPVKPWNKVALDITEGALAAAAAAATSLSLTIGWALFRGARIASEYVTLYKDRDNKMKSGLFYLLKAHRRFGYAIDEKRLSTWDRHDWRCSGSVLVPEPGAPLTAINQELVAQHPDLQHRTMRRIEQTKSTSVMQSGKDFKSGPPIPRR